VEGNANLSADP